MLTVLAAVVLATAPGALLALALPAGRDRWAAWAGAPALTLGLTGIAMGWLPRLGLPRRSRGGARRRGGPGRRRRPRRTAPAASPSCAPAGPRAEVPPRDAGPGLPGCPGRARAHARRAAARRVRRPTGLGRHEPRAADAQHPADRQHRGGVGVHLRLPPPGGVLRLLPAGGRRLLGPGGPADRRPGQLAPWPPGPSSWARSSSSPRSTPASASWAAAPSWPAPPLPRRPSSGRCTPRCSPAGRPSRPGPGLSVAVALLVALAVRGRSPVPAGAAGRDGRGRDRADPHVRRAVRRRPRGRAAGVGARPAHRAVGGVDARCRGRHHRRGPRAVRGHAARRRRRARRHAAAVAGPAR